MSSLITSLKSEITRIARKELKGEVQSLRKVTTTHRSEIAALKRQLKSMAAEIKALKRSSRDTDKLPSTDESEEKPTGIRFTAERFALLRSRLGLTKPEMARVLESSPLSVHKWESGMAQPRNAQLQKIAAAMKLGKREARAMLAQ